jgi:hypothetical protein
LLKERYMSQALWLCTVVLLVVWVVIRPWNETLSFFDLLLAPIMAVQIYIAVLQNHSGMEAGPKGTK